MPLLLIARQYLIRPPRTNLEQQLFKGIAYRRTARSLPRPIVLHIVTIDLSTPEIRVLVTPGKRTHNGLEFPARTTEKFVKDFKLQLAINANFFYPFIENSPWDYYPHTGEPVYAVGQAISNSREYSSSKPGWPVLCFAADQRAKILATGKCPQSTSQAVAGSAILVADGRPVSVAKNSPDNDKLYPRTAVAIDETGKKLWLVVIDGRQPNYSEGVSLAELTEILMELGVSAAINLDGGGSTALVVARSEPRLLNSPVLSKIPMISRPVANHLGIYAQPKN